MNPRNWNLSDKSDGCVSTGSCPQEERVNSSDPCENLGRQETVIPDFALETGLAKAMVGRKSSQHQDREVLRDEALQSGQSLGYAHEYRTQRDRGRKA